MGTAGGSCNWPSCRCQCARGSAATGGSCAELGMSGAAAGGGGHARHKTGGCDGGSILECWLRWVELTQLLVYLCTYMQKFLYKI